MIGDFYREYYEAVHQCTLRSRFRQVDAANEILRLYIERLESEMQTEQGRLALEEVQRGFIADLDEQCAGPVPEDWDERRREMRIR